MDELEKKTEDALEEDATKKHLRYVREYVNENFHPRNKKHLAFYTEYIINGGHGMQAYKKVYGEHLKNNVASVMASRLLSEVNLSHLLDAMGHGVDKFFDALNRLYKEDADKYLKYYSMYRKWDSQRVEHSGSIQINFEPEFKR